MMLSYGVGWKGLSPEHKNGNPYYYMLLLLYNIMFDNLTEFHNEIHKNADLAWGLIGKHTQFTCC